MTHWRRKPSTDLTGQHFNQTRAGLEVRESAENAYGNPKSVPGL